VQNRLPWLLVNLGTSLLGASVVYVFSRTIQEAVILAAIMPMVAGLGGNAGTQALAVSVRRIALAVEPTRGRWAVVLKEVVVGLVNGAVVGAVAAGLSIAVGGDSLLGLVVLLAMWGNILVANFAGSFVPILLDQLEIDPAVASSIFVTAFTDLSGFFLLLGFGSAILL
ncbi:MAG: magnesium transporter, partial [Gemmatimonadetes bacterium]|nr:magnesium transporter [Gemmatimonadota bacterium]